jgi:DNA polymerase elongation subunit (family B)
MASFLNEAITGEYNHAGDAIIYGDTDSCYFSAWPVLSRDENMAATWNKDVAIEIYDQLGDQVNESFPQFMERAFHTTRKNGEIIKCGRELVADRGIFTTKKRYAVNIIDKEGKRLDTNGKTGKIKAMGMDLKRADTPKYVQKFLLEILEDVLGGIDREIITNKIRDFKHQLSERDSWELGRPMSVKKLSVYQQQVERANGGKVNMPQNVKSSLNWNYLRKMNGDKYSQQIMDGNKIIVCRLRKNALDMDSVAYPTDELRLPQWFKDLPFDTELMISGLVDEKIENMIGVLDWDLRGNTNINSTFSDLFSFT